MKFFSLYLAVLGVLYIWNYSASSTFTTFFQALFSFFIRNIFQRAALPCVPRAFCWTFSIIKHYQTLSSNIFMFAKMQCLVSMLKIIVSWLKMLENDGNGVNTSHVANSIIRIKKHRKFNNFPGTKPNRITIKNHMVRVH